MRLARLSLIAVVACASDRGKIVQFAPIPSASTSAPSPPPVAAAPPPAAPGGCLKNPESPVDGAAVTADVVSFCATDGNERACFDASMSGAFAPAAVRPSKPPREVGAHTTVDEDGHVEICPSAGSCQTLTTTVAKSAAADDAGTRVAIVDNAHEGTLLVFDVAKPAKPIVTIQSWKTMMGAAGEAPFDNAYFLGADRLVAYAHCTPESDCARIFDLKGKKVGDVGGDGFTVSDGVPPFPLGAGQWAFLQVDAPTLVVVDAQTAKTRHKFDLSSVAEEANGYNSALAALLPHPDGKRWIAVIQSPAVTIVILDPPTNTIATKFAAPLCTPRASTPAPASRPLGVW